MLSVKSVERCDISERHSGPARLQRVADARSDAGERWPASLLFPPERAQGAFANCECVDVSRWFGAPVVDTVGGMREMIGGREVA